MMLPQASLQLLLPRISSGQERDTDIGFLSPVYDLCMRVHGWHTVIEQS